MPAGSLASCPTGRASVTRRARVPLITPVSTIAWRTRRLRFCAASRCCVGASRDGDCISPANIADCAIVGLGTCGSCTTFTIKDAVAVEDHAKPVVAIVCEEFIVHGRNVATHLGHGDLKILVLPYPLEARPAEELRAIADEYYPKLLELIGATA